jgi:hypothetical protein
VKTTFCLASTTIGSRHCAKCTGSGFPRCCSDSPRCSKSKRIHTGNPVRRAACRTRSAERVAPSTPDPAACSQSRSIERAARVPPVHAHSATRNGCGAGSGDARFV